MERSQTPTERSRYQLWPSITKADTILGRHTPDITDLRKLRAFKEQGVTRRRKISVPELGPMTTVQEKHLDSRESSHFSQCAVLRLTSLAATIPGRYPSHERSNSAPGASWDRDHQENSFFLARREREGLNTEARSGKLSQVSELEDTAQTWFLGKGPAPTGCFAACRGTRAPGAPINPARFRRASKDHCRTATHRAA
jgi:hypothetical protein